MIQKVMTQPHWQGRFTPRDYAALTPLIWEHANPTTRPLVQTLQWLHQRPDHDPATTIVDKAWQRHVVGDDGKVNARAFAFCALDKLRVGIRRRDVFVNSSLRYADPRAGRLAGAEWEAARPVICRSLELSAQPQTTLTALMQELDETYRRVAARLPDNDAVRFETVTKGIGAQSFGGAGRTGVADRFAQRDQSTHAAR